MYPLRVPVLSVGRANANTLRISDSRIAAHHVRIEREDSHFVLEVTANDAPTTLNGSELQPGDRRTLSDGDLIGLADLVFRFTDDHGDGVLGRLWVVAGVHRGKVFRVDRADFSIGRATDNDVQFPDRSVSRHHCRIRRSERSWWIEDLESTNGTIVHGAPLSAPVRLEHGDEVVTGFSRFVFQEGDRPLVNLRLEPTPPCN
ncbi:MAG: FHA domain-containing protein [Gemmatimonadota bacterium]|nr:MAG: FHA domain-containing protein [Gemmatimonadota bacterium]